MTGAVDSYSLWGNASSATFEASEELDEESTTRSQRQARKCQSDQEQVLAFIDWMYSREHHRPWCPPCGHFANSGWDLEFHISRRLPPTDMPEVLGRLLAPCPAHRNCEFEVRGERWIFTDGTWALANPEECSAEPGPGE